jgi:dynein heavy chain
MEKQEEDDSFIPMFLSELILTIQSLVFEPSLEDFVVCASSYNICK